MSREINYKVSVLVANYNNEKYLDQCLNSLLNQSYKNIEVVVLDDSSTDRSLEFIKKYKDNIRIVKKINKFETEIETIDNKIGFIDLPKSRIYNNLYYPDQKKHPKIDAQRVFIKKFQ